MRRTSAAGILRTLQIPGSYQTGREPRNDYLIDRHKQRTVNYSGLESVPIEDTAMMESMGPIYDRTQEHLGSSDVAVISTRRRLINAARQLADGIEPYPAAHPELYQRRSAVKVLAHDVPFLGAVRLRRCCRDLIRAGLIAYRMASVQPLFA